MIITAGTIITKFERKYVLDAVNDLSNPNRFDYYIRTFEENFAKFIGTKYAIAVSNGTAALHLALIALGIGEGDEVILPALGFVAAANAIKYVGATPVFVDVDPDTWCIDVASTVRAVTRKTKAIMPVYMYGNKPDMQRLSKLNTPLIEDACPAVGTRRAGTYGIGCFSFQGAKTLAIGEGGMVTTDNKRVHDRIRKMYSHGKVNSDFYYDEIGFNYRMSNIQAALGLGQLKHIKQLIDKKNKIHKWYGQMCTQEFTNDSVCWMSSTYECRPGLRKYLLKNEIDTRKVFPIMPSYPMYKNNTEYRSASFIATFGINLPSASYLTKKDIDYVKNNITSYY